MARYLRFDTTNTAINAEEWPVTPGVQDGFTFILDATNPIGSTLSGQTVTPPVASLPSLQAAKLTALAAYAATKQAAGFSTTISGVSESLQLRDATDRTNWLALKDQVDEAVAAGQGAANCATPVRCASNRQYIVTNQQAQDLMKLLRVWATAMQTNTWAKTDAIRLAPDAATLAAIDITAGWPS